MTRSTTRPRLLAAVLTLVVAVLAATLSTVPTASAAPAAPGGLTPNGTSVSGPPVLQWDRVSGASAYDVQVATNDTFGSLVWSTATYNRRATPNVQLPSGAAHWRVRAVGPTGTGPWATATFTRQALAGPSPLAPADGDVLDPPDEPALLSWSPLNGATQYTLEVSTDAQFVDSTRSVTYTTQASSYVVPDPVVATAYYWRVRASLGSGVVTQWSPVRSYTVGGLARPVLESPADSSATAVTDVVLDWEPVMGAKTYNLQISTDQNFNTIDHSLTGVTSTRYSPTSTLNNDQYYWRVSPVDSAGNTLDWADVDVWEFRRSWPDQPTLEWPGNNALVGDPFFYQWTPVPRASSYRVEVSRSADFSVNSMYDTCTTVNTTFTPQLAEDCFPQALGTYYWRVIALDGPTGVVSEAISSPVRRFTYDPQVVPQTAPADGASVEIPTLRWQATRGASEYDVTVTQVDNGNVVASARTTGISFTPRAKLEVGKTFRWQVKTVSASGRIGPGLLPGSQPTFTVVASTATPGATPVPATPSGTTSVRFPTLEWTPVTNATRYQVYVRSAGSVLWTALPDFFEYPAGEDRFNSWLAPDTYEWRVDAYNGATLLSGSSGSNAPTFVVDALPSVTGQHVALSGTAAASPTTSCSNALDPSLPLAQQQCMDLRATPVLTWDAQPNASRYVVWISRDQQLTNVIAKYETEQPTFTPPTALFDSQAGSAFYWHVQPCKVPGSCKLPEPAKHAFNKLSKPVQLQSPADGATVSNSITFSWRDYLATNQDATTAGNHAGVHSVEPDVEAYNYRVQVDNEPNFQSPLDVVLVDQTTYTAFGNTYPEGPLYWRVQAVDGSGNSLTWSTPRTFTKRSPQVTLTAPVDNAQISGTAPLRWEPLAYAASYDVEVYKDADTIGQSGNLVFSGNSKQVALTPTVPLPVAGTSYTWRVRPRDAAGRPGQWTDLAAPSARFRVVGGAPTLTAPQDGVLVVGTDTLFTWTGVSGATDYRWDLRLEGGGGLSQIRTPGLAWAPSIVSDGSWEWRVVSLNSAGVEIGSSPWWQFRVDAIAPAVAAVKPVGLVKRDANFQVTFSEPVKGVTKLTYKIFPAGSKRAMTATVKPSSDRRKATLNPSVNLKRGKSYTLKVLSKITDDAGNKLVAYSWTITAR